MEQPCLLTFTSLAKNAGSYKQTGWPFIITVSSLSLSSYSSQWGKKKIWSALLEKNSQSGNISKTDWAGGWACCAQSHSSIHAWDNHIRAPLYPSHWSLSTTTVMLPQLHIFIRALRGQVPTAVFSWMIAIVTRTKPPHQQRYMRRKSQSQKQSGFFFNIKSHLLKCCNITLCRICEYLNFCTDL